MENLIDISGYAESYEKLCQKVAEDGEFYNVLENGFFTTYRKTGGTEVGDLLETTDVIGWYQVKAELESRVPKPNDQDVYIVGLESPFTRYKATVRGVDVKWEEDGQEVKKILKNYKNFNRTGNKPVLPEEGIFYSVGKEAPYKLYGTISTWEPVGHFISHTKLYARFLGEVACVNGLFYIHTEDGWKPIEIKEPIENYTKHTYTTKDGTKCRIREGFALGTLEFYSPRE